MPFVPPNLDNRKFEDIVTEIRRRIPTFTPEWTDLNDSDPGMTLAQLFAFMSEQLLFQINQVPEKGLITFLKMVGGERHPASPAVADVTLSLKSTSSSSDTSFDVTAGTAVLTSGPPPGQKAPVRFETQIPFMLVNGDLVDVISIDCSRNVTSFAAVNASGTESFAPFPTGRVGEELYFVLDLNVPGATWPAGAFRLRVNAAGSTDVGEPPNDVTEPDAGPRLVWSFGSGTDGSSGVDVLTFTDFTPSEDSTGELIRSGYLELTFQDEAAALAFVRASSTDDITQFQNKFVIRARLARPDAFDDVGLPSLATIRLNTVPASAIQTVSKEALGASTGQPSQQFQLARTPVIVGSSTVQVTPPGGIGGPLTFTEIDDLFSAGPNDPVYELLPATGVLLFGDGVHGLIPPPDDGTAQGGNVQALAYQFGGGAVGNVGAQTLTNVTPSDATLPALKATNVLPAAGGADEETTDHAIATAPAIVRSRFRAVSADDFEALAKATPQVRVERALALPNTQPGAGAGTTPGAVTVVLVPFAPFESSITTPIPLPSQIAAAVLRFLDQRRLVTTQVFVQPATFRKVTANVSLVVQPLAKINDTRSAVLLALQTFFHALVGGTDGQGWPFGGTIFFSQVFQQVLNVPGVSRVEQLLLSLDDGTPVDCQDLPLNAGELLFSGSHTVLAQAETTG